MIREFFIGSALLCASAAGGLTLSVVHNSSLDVRVASLTAPTIEPSAGFVIPRLSNLREAPVSESKAASPVVKASLVSVDPADTIPSVETLYSLPPAQAKLVAPTVRKPAASVQRAPTRATTQRAPRVSTSTYTPSIQSSVRPPVATAETRKQVERLALSPEYLIGVFR